jgi:chemotaxis protein methyltransferase CheR
MLVSGQQKEFNFSRDDFDYLRKIVTEITGIVANEDKYSLYYSRLTRRVRLLGLSDFRQYREFLNNNRESEIIELVNSVTTNLTSFFRENHHFDFIKQSIIPQKIERGEHKLRVWSAGCSTGEEAYSIAITLAQCIPDYRSWDIDILATDLDTHVIEQAQNGVYAESRVKDIDQSLVQKYFSKDSIPGDQFVTVDPVLKNMVTFRQLNLLNAWPISHAMDFIFCRNVVIYFDKPTKDKLVNRFADQLINQGHLFMGHSESLFKSTDRFKLLSQTIYQKISTGNNSSSSR